ncbi:MAG: hypothetical protein E6G29_02830 [Actinobacteria bacterium]|nr:MAG: hypothetical protein E6G29_02830 [Actinomycetota bacterium]
MVGPLARDLEAPQLAVARHIERRHVAQVAARDVQRPPAGRERQALHVVHALGLHERRVDGRLRRVARGAPVGDHVELAEHPQAVGVDQAHRARLEVPDEEDRSRGGGRRPKGDPERERAERRGESADAAANRHVR